MDNYNGLDRYQRLMAIRGLPATIRRSLALAWCFGAGGDHANAAEHLLRALEGALEALLDEEEDGATCGAPDEGSGRQDGDVFDQGDAGGAREVPSGSGEAAAVGERPAARVDAGEVV